MASVRVIFLSYLFIAINHLYGIPLYFCTGASERYFPHLINLIGSIHKVNFENLAEIAVFDLGLKKDQIKQLSKIAKVTVYPVKKTHPDILTFFPVPYGKILGWFAWKPVVIKQALDMFPYILWVDAGTTVLRPLDDLFEYIQQHGYFICTSGDEIENGKFKHSVGWETTRFVREQFLLNNEQRHWILDQESVMTGIIGASKTEPFYSDCIMPWYQLTYDLRYYADDGTAPNGFGTCRYEQTLLSIFAYTLGITIHQQDYMQEKPIMLNINGNDVPFYITWKRKYLCPDKTHIYNSRFNLTKKSYYEKFIIRK